MIFIQQNETVFVQEDAATTGDTLSVTAVDGIVTVNGEPAEVVMIEETVLHDTLVGCLQVVEDLGYFEDLTGFEVLGGDPLFTDPLFTDVPPDTVTLFQSGDGSISETTEDGGIRVTDTAGNTLTYSGDPNAGLMLLGVAPEAVALDGIA